MTQLIREYQEGTLSLGRLVGDLQGSIDAMDPPLASEEEARFLGLWAVLEEAHATNEEERYAPLIAQALVQIEAFLSDSVA